MNFIPYLVAAQMPVMMFTGVYLLSLLFDRIDNRHPNWAINAAAFVLVSVLFAFTIPALYLAIETIK